jgi:sulfite exporter TauE/SafE
MGNINLITIFLTGLLTGGLTCMAVQGGLLAATLAQKETGDGNALPIMAFLGTKLIFHILLGLMLGLLGSFFQLSITLRIAMQIAVAVFMAGTALNILNVHPIFRYFVIQPPKWLTRLVRNQSKNKSMFAPAMLGAMTIFIPCGTTQAMMALAVVSGNPLTGAVVMGAFILGTTPVFFILGYLTTKLSERFERNFMKIAALVLIFLAVFNVNNAIALTGSNLTLDNAWKNIWCTISWCTKNTQVAQISSPVSEATISIENNQYNPNSITVRAGSDIKLHLQNTGGTSCIQAFTIPALGIQKIVPNGTTAVIEFTAPDKPQQISFMCSMGMYRGVINVI